MTYGFASEETLDLRVEGECSRSWESTPCGGELIERLSRSGLTLTTMCENHAYLLEDALDKIENRYPEIHHPEGCPCCDY